MTTQDANALLYTIKLLIEGKVMVLYQTTFVCTVLEASLLMLGIARTKRQNFKSPIFDMNTSHRCINGGLEYLMHCRRLSFLSYVEYQ